MTPEPAGIETYVPQFAVKFPAGSGITERDLSRDVSGIEIDETLDAPAMFRISLCEHLDTASQKFTWLDNENLRPGLNVELYIGYAQDKKVPHITGRIKGITPAFQSSSVPTMSLEGYDFLQDLQKSEKKISQENVSFSDIASEIAEKNNLSSAKVEPTSPAFPKIEREKNDKDFDLLKKIAEKIGYEFFVRNRTLYFRKPNDDIKRDIEPEFRFEYGINIINFNPRLATSFLANEVKVISWNRSTKETISATAGISDIRTGAGFGDMDRFIEEAQGERVSIKLEGRVVDSAQEAKDLAVAELKRRNNGFIQGTLEVAGNPRLRPGITVDVMKVGKRFSGRYYVTKAKHTLGEGGYKTSLEMRRCI